MPSIEPTNIPPPEVRATLNLTKQLHFSIKSRKFYADHYDLHDVWVDLKRLQDLLIIEMEEVLKARRISYKSDDILLGIIPYGSLDLKVYHRGEEVYVVLALSKHLRHCLNEIDLFLRKITKNRCTTQVLHDIKSFRITFYGMTIFLLCAFYPVESIPYDRVFLGKLILSSKDLVNTIAGRLIFICKLSEEINKIVKHSEKEFSIVLSAIKMWAKKRNILNHKVGFFGDYALAILTAKICLLHRHCSPASLVKTFFEVFSNWQWPNPVTLRDIKYINNSWEQWRQENYPEHLMPILSLYPETNLTGGITQYSKKVILQEMRFALAITKAIRQRKLVWDRLFEPASFFKRFKYFIVILFSTETLNDIEHISSIIEGELYTFCKGLENNNDDISYVQIGPQFYKQNGQILETNSPFCRGSFNGLEFISEEDLDDKLENIRISATHFKNHLVMELLERDSLKVGMQFDAQIVEYENLGNYFSVKFLKDDWNNFEKEKYLARICGYTFT